LLSGALCAAEALATATGAAMVPGTAGASSVVLPAMVTETSRTCAAAAVSCAAAMAGPSVYMEDSPTDWTGVPGIAQDNGKASGSERGSGGAKPNSVDEFLKTTEVGDRRGYTDQRLSSGGFEQAKKDFDKLVKPESIRPMRDNEGGKVGVTPQGDKVSVRPDSSGGQPTLQIDRTGQKIKVRYED
jgi:hypothetical protein